MKKVTLLRFLASQFSESITYRLITKKLLITSQLLNIVPSRHHVKKSNLDLIVPVIPAPVFYF